MDIIISYILKLRILTIVKEAKLFKDVKLLRLFFLYID